MGWGGCYCFGQVLTFCSGHPTLLAKDPCIVMVDEEADRSRWSIQWQAARCHGHWKNGAWIPRIYILLSAHFELPIAPYNSTSCIVLYPSSNFLDLTRPLKIWLTDCLLFGLVTSSALIQLESWWWWWWCLQYFYGGREIFARVLLKMIWSGEGRLVALAECQSQLQIWLARVMLRWFVVVIVVVFGRGASKGSKGSSKHIDYVEYMLLIFSCPCKFQTY